MSKLQLFFCLMFLVEIAYARPGGGGEGGCSQCVEVRSSVGPISPGKYCLVRQEGDRFIIADPNGGMGRVGRDVASLSSCDGASSDGNSGNSGFPDDDNGTNGSDSPVDNPPDNEPDEPNTNPGNTGSSAAIGEKHFMIQAANYNSLSDAKKFPLFVYGFATDPALKTSRGDINRFISQVNIAGVFAKMLIFSSAAAAEEYLSKASVKTALRNAGVEWIGYNQEGDKTPGGPHYSSGLYPNADEWSNKTAAVVKFARIVHQNGFKFIWGPIRSNADVSSSAMQQMCQAGLDGIALQEQNNVQGDGSNRIYPVLNTIRAYRAQCGSDFYITVQIMWGQGGNCSNSCTSLVRGIQNEVNSISIWAGQEQASEVNRALKANSFFLGTNR